MNQNNEVMKLTQETALTSKKKTSKIYQYREFNAAVWLAFPLFVLTVIEILLRVLIL